ncbi:MAG TPA: ribosome biogenesis GTPase Der [bacterium (Candidatus Stahlbacteria)]|nr:ribosome biogenesis GTPase Der [Candidatus Stahlbacteria bacterium]
MGNRVAIVGRENVGKSTLFNRLLRSRIAVIHETPGITRDRIMKEAEIDGKQFLLMDTGGLLLEEATGIKAKVKKQVEIALKEADLILFMVDVTTGITPLDTDVASLLYKSGKKAIVVANKADNPKLKREAIEFYKLGFTDVIPISALHGIGIGILRDKILDYVEGKAKKKKEYPKIAILGRPNVGKSTYINAIVGEERMIVDERPGTTIDSVDLIINYNGKILNFIDTPGARRMAKVRGKTEYYSLLRTKRTIGRCDASILLVEAPIGLTHQDKRIISELIEAGKGIVIALNKIDLGINFYEDELRFANFIPIFYISALKRENIYEPIDCVLSVLRESKKSVGKDKLKNILPKLSKVGVRGCVQKGISPPTFEVKSRNKLNPNHKKYVERVLRENFGFQGVPIRIRD